MTTAQQTTTAADRAAALDAKLKSQAFAVHSAALNAGLTWPWDAQQAIIERDYDTAYTLAKQFAHDAIAQQAAALDRGPSGRLDTLKYAAELTLRTSALLSTLKRRI